MRNALLSLLILGLLAGCQSRWAAPTTSCSLPDNLNIRTDHPKAAQLQEIMDRYIAQGIPGAIVLIEDPDGLWIGSSGYADLAEGIPMETCHINKLGSVTKMMVGAVIWQLVQTGQVDIDAPIERYVPELAADLPDGDQILVSMLLDHSSGIYDIGRDLGYNLAVANDFVHAWTADEILSYVNGKEPSHSPGTDFRYSNTNTLIQGLIIESVTGRPHAEVLQEWIFDRLGMEGTIYFDYDGPFPDERLAQGYLDFHNDGGDIQNISAMNPGSGQGFTGVYSTVTDMRLFIKALLQDRILTTPANLERIFATFPRDTREGFSRFSIGGIMDEYQQILPEGIHAYGHAGGDIGYSACLNYLPHNETIFAATVNYGTNLPTELGRLFEDMREELVLTVAE